MDYKLERLEQAAKLESSGNWKKLLTHCQEWTTFEPSNCMAWQGVGDALTHLGDDIEAIKAYKRGLEVAPAHPIEFFGRTLSAAALWYRLGNGYSTLGDHASAISALRKAASIDPNSVDVWNNLGIAYWNGNLVSEAFQAFKTGIGVDPRNVFILTNMGNLYARCQMREGVLFIHQMLCKVDHKAAAAFLQSAEQTLAK